MSKQIRPDCPACGGPAPEYEEARQNALVYHEGMIAKLKARNPVDKLENNEKKEIK